MVKSEFLFSVITPFYQHLTSKTQTRTFVKVQNFDKGCNAQRPTPNAQRPTPNTHKKQLYHFFNEFERMGKFNVKPIFKLLYLRLIMPLY
jgi:hypothetical protein